MAPKRPATNQSGSCSKKSRKSLTLDVKLDILKRYEQGQKTIDIVRATGFSESTLRTIRSSKDKINKCIAHGSSASLKQVSSVRHITMTRMEELLKDWISKQNRRSVPVTMGIIQAKAKELYKEITKDEDEPRPFQASNGWFAKFKLRHGFHNVKFSGEAASADETAAKDFVSEIQAFIKEKGYRPEQVFNLDETALYPYRMFDRSYISVNEKKRPGVKASKKRVTILVGTNMVGHKLKPMLIGTAERPHCFRGLIVENLPVYYYHNKKGWMNSYVWGHYTSFSLENELRAYCHQENIDFKILLLVDNFSGHNEAFTVESDYITVKFLPPNTTSLIQPMDQGIIRMFKCNYTKLSLQKMVSWIDAEPEEEDAQVVEKYWSAFNLKNAIYLLSEAWECVTERCIQGAWRKLFPDLIPDFQGFDLVSEEAKLKQEMLLNARQVGFNEVDEEDVNKLLDSHDEELSTDELLQMQLEREQESEKSAENLQEEKPELKQMTVSVLGRILGHFEEGMRMLDEHDRNPDRVFKVQGNVRQALRTYYELQRKLRALAKQQTLDVYVSTRSSTPAPTPESNEEQEPEPEPQPSTSGYKSGSRQLTLMESLSAKSDFHGFDESQDLPDLATLSDTDKE